jgi:hypothetical protein
VTTKAGEPQTHDAIAASKVRFLHPLECADGADPLCGEAGLHGLAHAPDERHRLVAQERERVGFAEGAVRAAEWIKGKTGFYEFPEIVDQL